MIGCVESRFVCCDSVVVEMVPFRKSSMLGAAGSPAGGAGNTDEEAFSIRAQVRYTSNSKSKMPSRMMEDYVMSACVRKAYR